MINMIGLKLRWSANSSSRVVSPGCCAASTGTLHLQSKTARRKRINTYASMSIASVDPFWVQQFPQSAASRMHDCYSAHTGQQSNEQQLWLPQQHIQLLLQMQQPAHQVQQHLLSQQTLQAAWLQSAVTRPGELMLSRSNSSSNNGRGDDGYNEQCSRPAGARSRGHIVAMAAAGMRNVSSGSDSGNDSSDSGGTSGSLKTIRERMKQRVTSRVTQSSQLPQSSSTSSSSAAAAAAAAAATDGKTRASAPTVKRLPPILPSATNETSISDVLQQLQHRLGKRNGKQGNHSTELASSSSSVSSRSPGENFAAGQTSSTVLGRKRRQPEQHPDIRSTEQEHQKHEFMTQQRLQLLHQEQQQRKRQQLMQKAQMKEQRAAAFKQLQASADAALKQHAALSPKKASSASQHDSSTCGSSTSSGKGRSSTRSRALKPAKAQAYMQQLTSRSRTGRRRAANKASASVAAAAAADTDIAAKPGLQCTISAAAAAAPRPARAAATSAAVVASRPAARQLATQLCLDEGLVQGLLAIVAKTGLPAVLQHQLLEDYAAGKPGIPRNPTFLARRLMHYSQAAALLGGPSRACSILQRDTSLMLMAPGLLQRKLLHLQHLLAAASHTEADPPRAPGAAAAAVEDAGSSDGSSSSRSAASSTLPPAGSSSVTSNASSSSRSRSSRRSAVEAANSSFTASPEVLRLVQSHPGLVRLSVAGLEERLAALQHSLGLSSIQAVVQVVMQQPRVLSMNEAALQGKVWGMAATIRVPPASIQSLYTKQPLLLNLSASTLTEKVLALQQTLGLSAQHLWEMLCCKPGVLLFSSNKISKKWAVLQQLAEVHPRWRSELAELSPASLVQLLTASELRLARLHHVVAVGGQDLQALYYTVNQQSEKHFKAKFPKYDVWLAQTRGRQGPAGAGNSGSSSSSAAAVAAHVGTDKRASLR